MSASGFAQASVQPARFAEYETWEEITFHPDLGALARLRVPGGFLYALAFLSEDTPASHALAFVPFVHDAIDEERASARRSDAPSPRSEES